MANTSEWHSTMADQHHTIHMHAIRYYRRYAGPAAGHCCPQPPPCPRAASSLRGCPLRCRQLHEVNRSICHYRPHSTASGRLAGLGSQNSEPKGEVKRHVYILVERCGMCKSLVAAGIRAARRQLASRGQCRSTSHSPGLAGGWPTDGGNGHSDVTAAEH
jgi:hypothetical protein